MNFKVLLLSVVCMSIALASESTMELDRSSEELMLLREGSTGLVDVESGNLNNSSIKFGKKAQVKDDGTGRAQVKGSNMDDGIQPKVSGSTGANNQTQLETNRLVKASNQAQVRVSISAMDHERTVFYVPEGRRPVHCHEGCCVGFCAISVSLLVLFGIFSMIRLVSLAISGNTTTLL